MQERRKLRSLLGERFGIFILLTSSPALLFTPPVNYCTAPAPRTSFCSVPFPSFFFLPSLCSVPLCFLSSSPRQPQHLTPQQCKHTHTHITLFICPTSCPPIFCSSALYFPSPSRPTYRADLDLIEPDASCLFSLLLLLLLGNIIHIFIPL